MILDPCLMDVLLMHLVLETLFRGSRRLTVDGWTAHAASTDRLSIPEIS